MNGLSKPMRDALKKICLDSESSKISGSTRNALEARNLIKTDNTLTELGKVEAISLLPLKEQCNQLGIALEVLELTYNKRPEDTLIQFFAERGYVGTSNEGLPIQLMLKALALDVLSAINTFNSREDACTRFLEAQLTIHSDKVNQILESTLGIEESAFLDNINELMSYPSNRELAPSLDESVAKAFFDKLGKNKMTELLKLIAQDPYVYRAGWPDLALIKDSKLKFVEVKTSDKLHHSQIRLIPKLMKTIDCEISVCKLK